MRNELIPDFPQWLISKLYENPKQVLLIAYSGDPEKLIGCILTDDIYSFHFEKAGHLSFRMLRAQLASETKDECVVCHAVGISGFIFQQELTAFICAGCVLGN